ncbi:MAG: NAD(P)/FAD-dependent oxidoreductase [Actinobacteria bacterium]|nr:NAD(P)/FAD-dependent oxidoreductase [Actinomycetota bacterium]
MPECDVVVIGAGNGGLTAALTLARAGRKVLLLERHNVPGGCATSFVRGRFEFEVALHQLSGVGRPERPGPLRSLLTDLGVFDKLEFVEIENLYRIVIPGVFDATLPADRPELVKALQGWFPDERDAINRFFEFLYAFSLQYIQGRFFADAEISKEKYPLYFKYSLKSTQEILDQYFTSPLLKAVISVYWSYLGVPPSKLPFGEFAVMLFSYIEFKPFHLKGGSQAMSSALLDAYLAAGGEAWFNCGAERILVEDGAVRGVRTEHGTEVRCRRVVSNASTVQTYLDLLDRADVPDSALEAFKSSSIGPSAFTVYMGFDCEPADLGIQDTTNFIVTSTDSDRAFDLWRTMEPQGWALLSCYDVADPGFSPPGACQAALVALQYADPWYSVSPQQYAEVKHRYAEGMLQLAEQVFPGLRGHIEEAEAASPLTHLRYLGHPGGAIYGLDQFAKDTQPFLSRRSPIQGLYFAGAWVGSGGFQATLTSGRSTARSILKDMAR